MLVEVKYVYIGYRQYVVLSEDEIMSHIVLVLLLFYQRVCMYNCR